MNVLTVSGSLTKTPELKYTKNSTPVIDLNIYESEQKTFLDITAYGEIAQNLRETKEKDEIQLEGYVRKRNYTNKNNQKIYKTEIIALRLINE